MKLIQSFTQRKLFFLNQEKFLGGPCPARPTLRSATALAYHISDVIMDKRSEGTLILISDLDELLPFSKLMKNIVKLLQLFAHYTNEISMMVLVTIRSIRRLQL